jgi:hypothetical protein
MFGLLGVRSTWHPGAPAKKVSKWIEKMHILQNVLTVLTVPESGYYPVGRPIPIGSIFDDG